MIWFTSDPHYYHKNVIKLCNRPFNNLHEMHEHMIQEWNKRIKKATDKVYVLGDFAFANYTMTEKITSRLNGHKILVLGNHDYAAHKMFKAGFQEVHENHYIEIGNKQKIFLSHFPFHPMTSYSKEKDAVYIGYPFDKVDTRYMHKRMVDDGKSWLLHGHVHCAWKQNERQINVGVDVWDFKPVPHEKILQMIEKGPAWEGKTLNDYGD